MSEIKVNTDDLRNSSSTFRAEAETLNAALVELMSVLNSLDLGKYQSQLSEQVRSRVVPTQEEISIYQQRLQELADQLKNKALEFEQANAATVNDVTLLSNQMAEFTNSSSVMTASATLRMIDTKHANRIWEWGGGTFGNIKDWIISLIPPKKTEIGTNNENPEDLKNEDTSTEIVTNSTQNQNNNPGTKYNPKSVYLTPGVVPMEGEECVVYAKRRRESLGAAGGEDRGAYNYKNHPGVFQVDEGDNDLTQIIAEGYAIIWDKDPNATTVISTITGVNAKFGHVAIIEAFLKDKIIISEANPVNLRKEISIDDLKRSYIYILP